MDALFLERITKHIDHVRKMGTLCTTEETTKQALILPFLDILGFSAFDPRKVRAEYQADFVGAKYGERVDYALFCNEVPVMFIEAKGYNEKLDNHCPQLSRYFNATPEVSISIITNGQEWRFFTDLDNKNVMDEAPFLTINFSDLQHQDINQLYSFRHDQFQPESLRILAEESIYLTAFTDAISDSLRNVDADFVKFIANKAKIQRQLNQRFIDSITPLVKQAVENSVSSMVLTGLSTQKINAAEQIKPAEKLADEAGLVDIVDPDNDKIVTTVREQMLLENVLLILGSKSDVEAKDTASYFGVLYQGKTTRWVIRYYDSKQRPSIQFPFPLTEEHIKNITKSGLEIGAGDQVIIDVPENILRVSALVIESYEYNSNDENFKRKQ